MRPAESSTIDVKKVADDLGAQSGVDAFDHGFFHQRKFEKKQKKDKKN